MAVFAPRVVHATRCVVYFFFFQAEDGIRDLTVTGVQTCALPISYTKYLLLVLVLGAIVWGTPHTMIADSKELAAMGGSHHPFLGALGVMSAKNTAVNLMILTTFLSFLLYRRANTRPVVPWAKTGTQIQAAMFAVAAGVVLFYGIRGDFVGAVLRIGFRVFPGVAAL